MKLIFCGECQDVFNLKMFEKKCGCGESGGKYVDNISARIWGQSIPLGFANSTFMSALANQPEEGQGVEFSAFVIPKSCGSISVVK